MRPMNLIRRRLTTTSISRTLDMFLNNEFLMVIFRRKVK